MRGLDLTGDLDVFFDQLAEPLPVSLAGTQRTM